MLASVSDGLPLREVSGPISSSVQSSDWSWATGAAASSLITGPPRTCCSGARARRLPVRQRAFAAQFASSRSRDGRFRLAPGARRRTRRIRRDDQHAPAETRAKSRAKRDGALARAVAHALHLRRHPAEGPMHRAAVAGHDPYRNGTELTARHGNVVRSSPAPASPARAAFSGYLLDHAYDEMFAASGQPRPHCQPLVEDLLAASLSQLRQHQTEADRAFLTQGITFTVYGDEAGTERIFPYDLLPRIITAAEWATIERGLTQRLTAINLFLRDIYHEGRILSEGIVPRDLVYSSRHYRRETRGVQVHG